jgi:hypothetical protein
MNRYVLRTKTRERASVTLAPSSASSTVRGPARIATSTGLNAAPATSTTTCPALLGRVMPGHIQVTRLLLDPLSDQDLDHLRDTMTRARDHMRAQPPRSSAPRKNCPASF